MSIYIGNKEVKGLYLGNKAVKEAWIGDKQIYPIGLAYVITNVHLYYSAYTQIYANATNYAYATGTVQVYRGSTLVQTLTNVPLTPVTISNPSHFYADGNNVKGYHLHTSRVDTGYTTNVTWGYLTATPVSSSAVTQQTNTPSSVVSSATVECNPSTKSISATETYVSCYLSLTRNLTTTWTSGEKEYPSDHQGSASVYVNGREVTSLSHGGHYDVFFGENQSLDPVTKTVKMTYSYDTRSYSDSDTITQSAGYYTYGKPVITCGCNDIPAKGDTIPTYGSATQTYGWNGKPTGVGTLTNIPITWSTPTFRVDNLGTNPKSRTLLGTLTASCISHSVSADNVRVSCYQQENKIERDNIIGRGEKEYGTPTINTRNPVVAISANHYTSSNNPCPAMGNIKAGVDVILSYSAQRDEQTVTPWTRDVTHDYTWTSESHSTKIIENEESGVDTTDWTTKTYTPTISGEEIGFDRQGATVTIYDRLIEEGAARSVTYTASFDGQSRNVTIYQQYNRIESTRTETLWDDRNHLTEIWDDGYEIFVTPTGDHLNLDGTGFSIAMQVDTYHIHHVADKFEVWKATKTISTYTSGHDASATSSYVFDHYDSDEDISIVTDTAGVTKTSWITATASVISAGENTTGSLRSGTVTYYNPAKPNDVSYTINISQKAHIVGYLRIYDSGGFEIPDGSIISLAASEYYPITVSSSASWTLTTPTLPVTITISPKSGSAGDTSVSIRTRNAPSRMVICTFNNGSMTKEITLEINM